MAPWHCFWSLISILASNWPFLAYLGPIFAFQFFPFYTINSKILAFLLNFWRILANNRCHNLPEYHDLIFFSTNNICWGLSRVVFDDILGLEPMTPEMIFHVFGLKSKIRGVLEMALSMRFNSGLSFMNF